MLAALDLATGQMTYRIQDRKRWQEFLALLKVLRSRWPGQKLSSAHAARRARHPVSSSTSRDRPAHDLSLGLQGQCVRVLTHRSPPAAESPTSPDIPH
jgi:hypothetical protein